ncbi:septation protein A [Liberibacter crescens]|nr:septation protein A [Liberibacter crescens]
MHMTTQFKEQSKKIASNSQLIKFFLEIGPLLVFFLSNFYDYDEKWISKFGIVHSFGGKVFIATGLFMIATIISLILSWFILRSFPVVLFVSGGFVLFFGALTLWFHDESFIKLKPTVIYMLFASVLLGGLVLGKSLLSLFFGEVFCLTAEGWRKLTLRWGIFFIFLAILNEIIRRNFSTEFWALFKISAIIPLTMLFSLLQFKFIKKYSVVPSDES